MPATLSPRRLSRWLPMLSCLLLLAPAPAFTQPASAYPTELAPAEITRLEGVVNDSALPSWQRDPVRALLASRAHALTAAAPRALVSRSTGSGEATWTNVLQPFEREQHTAIYDPVRDRIVLFGGDTAWEWDDDVWVLPLSGTPLWTKLPTAGTPPNHRVGHSAIYDPVRDRMVVFGGNDATYDQSAYARPPYYLNDVWTLSLSGTPTWNQLTPGGTPPAPRGMHSAIYDPVRDRMVVYGGFGYYYGGLRAADSDVWALSLSGTPVWTELPPPGSLPAARYGHTAIYDPLRDRMVVFGGTSAAGYPYFESNDVWALSLSDVPAWSNLSPSGTPPSHRARATAIYDPVRDRMIVTGGEGIGTSQFGGIGVQSDTWALSLSGAPAWTKLALPIFGRTEHAALYDPLRDRMLVVGGWNYGVRGEVWALALPNPPSWSAVTRPQPTFRTGPQAIYDSARNTMVMYGGLFQDWHTWGEIYGGYYKLGDTWTIPLAGPPTWTRLATTGTLPDPLGAAIYDPVRDRMLVFGMLPGSVDLNDVRALPLSGAPAWTQLTTSGPPLSGLIYPSAIYDPVRDRMLIFAGQNSAYPYHNEVWALSLSGVPAWSQLTPSGIPPGARFGQTAVYDPAGDRMVVFGGADASGSPRNDAWALTLSGPPAWSEMTPAGVPPAARQGHSAIYDPLRARMVVFGGRDSTGALDDVRALSLTGPPAWVELLGAGAQRVTRSLHSAIYDPTLDRMVIFGGFDDVGTRNDVWALEFASPTPTLVSLVSARPFPDRVELLWQLGPGGISSVNVYRGAAAGGWRTLETVVPDGVGRVSVVDRDVVPGTRYGYRLGLVAEGQENLTAETWVETPPAFGFSLAGGQPNPSRGRLNASFTLPAAGPATLELLDVGGRRLAAREVGTLGAGSHSVDLTPERALAPGIYLLRLTRDGRAATARAAVVR